MTDHCESHYGKNCPNCKPKEKKSKTVQRVEAILGRDIYHENVMIAVNELCDIIDEYKKREAARGKEKEKVVLMLPVVKIENDVKEVIVNTTLEI